MGWWFGRKSAPADARPFVPAWLQSDAGEEGFARSYSAQFEEVYRKNPVGQRAVRLVAGMLGALTIDGDARAVELVRADGLLEAIAANVLLHGNAYLRLIADDDDVPLELVQMRPERVGVISDENGWPVGYLYRAGGQAARIARCDALGRRQVAHVKALHPRDDHYGMGCSEAAIAAASVHNRASRWNKALLDNAARPSGALSYEPSDGSVLTGEWVDHANAIASFSNSGWRFMAAVEGMSVYARSTGIDARFRAGAWEYGNVRASALIIGDQQVVGSRAAAIAGPSGGTVIDSAARTTIGQILAALRQHGLIET